MSRIPCPASSMYEPSASINSPASTDATTCGVCEIKATARSCSSILLTTGNAPRDLTNSSTTAIDSAEVDALLAITQGRSRNRFPCAPIAPETSRPAMGCPPTIRSQPPETSCSSSRKIDPLTLATSVITALGCSTMAAAITLATFAGGVATNTTAIF